MGYLVENYDDWMKYINQQGLEILMCVDDEIPGMGHVRAAYLQSDDMGNVLIELIEARPPQ
jgi:hypothetical protein